MSRKKHSAQIASVTIQIASAVGALWEQPPHVGYAGHGDSQEPFHQHQGLLLRGDALREQHCFLEKHGNTKNSTFLSVTQGLYLETSLSRWKEGKLEM